MRVVLIGNYGVGNFGDEALRMSFQSSFPEVTWQVVSHRPHGTDLPRLPLGLRSLVTTPWRKTVGAIWRADAVVFGGGTLFTDVESLRACFLWGFHAFVAWVFRRPFLLGAQGVGPFRTKMGEWIARWIITHAAFVSVRDRASFERVRRWRGKRVVVQTFDPVFLAFLKEKVSHDTKNVFIVIPRQNSADSFRTALRSSSALSAARTRLLLFQPEVEQGIAAEVRSMLPEIDVRQVRTVEDVMQALADASGCLSERFHGALAAIAADVPLTVVPQAEGDKMGQALRDAQELGVAELQRQAEAGEKALRMALEHL